MSQDLLLEEFEVLESIYPTELSKISENVIEINVEPDDIDDGTEPLRLTLTVHYTDGYPDKLPDLSLEAIEGELEDDELESLLHELRTIGEENLGMAMTFTLVSHLREKLSHLVRLRAEKTAKEEEVRTRGTPVVLESFLAWKLKFDRELALKKSREEDEKMKSLTPKEREEWKRAGTRLSGRQLFERNRNLEDDNLLEEGTVSVDFSQYERTQTEEEDEEDRVRFSDSE
ncbi:hypothetical protein PILCRDRAFT_95926 [Piloderma croceum F 1598]|uniref:RWD domain-containing protein n=1 Tax=Piloderma croceum (strain F 1598) TaxID=765440 RepID=A0A0C3G5F4_PILCF|nr:hypothetical protein PILCRDRAFT_95926 [Piloderma croceum F 1598]